MKLSSSTTKTHKPMTSQTKCWGDLCEEADGQQVSETPYAKEESCFATPAPRTEVLGDGRTLKEEFKKGPDGALIKTVTTTQKTRRLRRARSKFGACTGMSNGPEKGITTTCYDSADFEWSGGLQTDARDEGQAQEDAARAQRLEAALNRTLGGENSGLKKLQAWNQRNKDKLGVQEKARPARYVPPSRDRGEVKEWNLVLSNLPMETTRNDIQEVLRFCRYTSRAGGTIALRPLSI